VQSLFAPRKRYANKEDTTRPMVDKRSRTKFRLSVEELQVCGIARQAPIHSSMSVH
jgi:hypothetical protein